ncbi:MAG TPA: class GN sortase [Hyphomonadaceae bacterium]|nr:class GN sortase [Hyphomonadaceae bacterium]
MSDWFMRTGAFLAIARDTPQPASKAVHQLKPSRHASPRTLTAIALLIAGTLIAAQALYIPAKAQVAQVLMSNAWAQQLKTGDLARPWPWADFAPAARLNFPTQNRSVLAVTDASGESLAFGPTLMAASVKPGASGVAVFAAHRDTHFAFLKDVKPGDEIDVQLQDGSRRFRVTGSQVVRWDASGIHTQDGGAPRIALVTCWPLDAKTPGPMRYVVWAELIPEPLSASTPSQV